MNRRVVLEWLVHGAGLAVTAVIFAPSLVMGLSPALKVRRGPTWRSLGPLEGFPVGHVREAVVERSRNRWPAAVPARSVYVWRPFVDQIVVFSRTCTDLGCGVKWDAGSGCYFCPCHGGIFSHDGQRMAGPPDRPLYRYENRVRDNELEIDLASVPMVARA